MIDVKTACFFKEIDAQNSIVLQVPLAELFVIYEYKVNICFIT